MMVKTCAGAAALFLTLALPAAAAPDADAAAKLAKDSGCTKCHAADKAKKGPSYQKISAKFKGQADAELKLTEFLSKSPKVKMDDGSEEDHKAANAKDPGQLRNLVLWILAQ